MTFGDLPAINACLNGASALFLGAGYVLIRQGRWRAHRGFMLAAFVTSTLFLLCYLTFPRIKFTGWDKELGRRGRRVVFLPGWLIRSFKAARATPAPTRNGSCP